MTKDPTVWISEHFRWDEFRCSDGTAVPARYRANVTKLCETMLEPIREAWGRPVTILSGYRTPTWNGRVEGAKASQHLLGCAADIVIAGVTPAEVYLTINDMMDRDKSDMILDGGLGKYRTFTHVDIGPPRRWRG